MEPCGTPHVTGELFLTLYIELNLTTSLNLVLLLFFKYIFTHTLNRNFIYNSNETKLSQS